MADFSSTQRKRNMTGYRFHPPSIPDTQRLLPSQRAQIIQIQRRLARRRTNRFSVNQHLLIRRQRDTADIFGRFLEWQKSLGVFLQVMQDEVGADGVEKYGVGEEMYPVGHVLADAEGEAGVDFAGLSRFLGDVVGGVVVAVEKDVGAVGFGHGLVAVERGDDDCSRRVWIELVELCTGNLSLLLS